MKDIEVKLIHVTPEECVINGIEKPYRNEKADIKLVHKVYRQLKHKSVSEHIWFHFNIKGSSRLELQEHMRHRMSSSTVESTRFVLTKILEDFGNVNIKELFVHPDFDKINKYKDVTEEMKTMFFQEYHNIINMMFYSLRKLQDNGFKGKKYNDILKYFLIEGLRTQIAWSINLSSLMNFFELRRAESAHFEIRQVANQIYDLVKETWVAPLLEEKYNENNN